jgi:hypothetical protein
MLLAETTLYLGCIKIVETEFWSTGRQRQANELGFFFQFIQFMIKTKQNMWIHKALILSKKNFKKFTISYAHKGSLTGIWTGMDGYIILNLMTVVLQLWILRCYIYVRVEKKQTGEQQEIIWPH